MNIPILNIFGTDSPPDTAAEDKKSYTLQVGILSSALEHAVPEQLFTTDSADPADAISAVKALSKASAAGQRIYHITQANQGTALPNINHDPDTMVEIRNALAVGKEVIMHTDAIIVPGWSGVGYIISDPVTGGGAYKISGGTNGSVSKLAESSIFISSAALGYVDGAAAVAQRHGQITFSDRIRYLQKMARTSAALQLINFLVSIYNIWSDDSLSIESQLGRTFTALLGIGVTAYFTAAAAVVAPLAIIPILVGVMLAISMTILMTIANNIWFALLYLGKMRYFV